jgi:hypothetical protein
MSEPREGSFGRRTMNVAHASTIPRSFRGARDRPTIRALAGSFGSNSK